MDADDHKIEAVFKEDHRFIVPLYQRKYQWAEQRLLPIWEDVQAKAAEVLAGESRFEHYVGALIIAPVDIGSQISKTPVVQVVDGQQRLTTAETLYHIALGSDLPTITVRANACDAAARGEEIGLTFTPARVHPFDSEGQRGR